MVITCRRTHPWPATTNLKLAGSTSSRCFWVTSRLVVFIASCLAPSIGDPSTVTTRSTSGLKVRDENLANASTATTVSYNRQPRTTLNIRLNIEHICAQCLVHIIRRKISIKILDLLSTTASICWRTLLPTLEASYFCCVCVCSFYISSPEDTGWPWISTNLL